MARHRTAPYGNGRGAWRGKTRRARSQTAPLYRSARAVTPKRCHLCSPAAEMSTVPRDRCMARHRTAPYGKGRGAWRGKTRRARSQTAPFHRSARACPSRSSDQQERPLFPIARRIVRAKHARHRTAPYGNGRGSWRSRDREAQDLALRAADGFAARVRPRGTGPRATGRGRFCRARETARHRTSRYGPRTVLPRARDREAQDLALRAADGFAARVRSRGTGPRATGRGRFCRARETARDRPSRYGPRTRQHKTALYRIKGRRKQIKHAYQPRTSHRGNPHFWHHNVRARVCAHR